MTKNDLFHPSRNELDIFRLLDAVDADIVFAPLKPSNSYA